MENLTHSFVGTILYRSGFQRYAPNTLPLWVIAANLPDIDILSRLSGKAAYLNYHRGLTHSFPGILLLSALLATIWWGGQALYKRYLNNAQGESGSLGLSWLRLFVCSLISMLSHPLLDSLNNYGVRPGLPLNNSWFYGDLVFILDPWLWLFLGGAVFWTAQDRRLNRIFWPVFALSVTMLLLFSQVSKAISLIWIAATTILILLRYRTKLGELVAVQARVARLSLVLVSLYLLMLISMQHLALQQAAIYLKNQAREPVERFSVSPTPANPLLWEVLGESTHYFYYGRVTANKGTSQPLTALAVMRTDPLVKRALQTPDGQAIGNFSRYLITGITPKTGAFDVILCDGRYSRDIQDLSLGFSCFTIEVKKD